MTKLQMESIIIACGLSAVSLVASASVRVERNATVQSSQHTARALSLATCAVSNYPSCARDAGIEIFVAAAVYRGCEVLVYQ